MYGSVFRLRPRPGHEQALIEELIRWRHERYPQAVGFVGWVCLAPESRSGEYVNTLVFRSREAYLRNANDPEQDRWYCRLRSHLESDPEWEDGEVLWAV